MAWSYSGDPASSDKDAVRFWVQDTDSAVPLLSDEEIQYLLDLWIPQYGSVIFTAAVAAEVVAAKYTGEVSVSADGVSVQVGDLSQRFQLLASRLREQYKQESAGAEPFLSGVMWDQVHDASIKPLIFGVGFMDNYEVGKADYGDYSPTDAPDWYTHGSADA